LPFYPTNESASSLGAAEPSHRQPTPGRRIPEYRDAFALSVEALNAREGLRLFISQDYLEFTMVDGAAVALFNHFTTNNNKE
jgi:hypothetical protein